jgi:predicted N-acetyltransferase YhbS
MIVEVDAREFRNELIGLYRADGNQHVEQIFDWYYTDSGSDRTRTWVLRHPDDGKIIGTSSVVFRTLYYNARPVVLAVSGNLIVHPEHRSAFAAIQLIRTQRLLLDQRSCDLIVGVPLPASRKILRALKYHRIGFLEAHTHVLDAAPYARARFGTIGYAAGGIANFGLAAARALRRSSNGLAAVELSTAELDGSNAEDWTDPEDTLVHRWPLEFIRWRVTQPGVRSRVFALHAAGVRAGVITLDEAGASRASITGCLTNARLLQPADAIMATLKAVEQDYAALSVVTFSGSPLSRRLRVSGFVPRGGGSTGAANELLGLWRSDHPLANVFGDPSRWSFFRGLNDI